MEDPKVSFKLYKYLDNWYEPTEEEFFDIIYTQFICCICRSSCVAPCWRADDGDVICRSCRNKRHFDEYLSSDGTLIVPIKHGILPCKFACSFIGTIEENTRHEEECVFKRAMEEWNDSLNRQDEKCIQEEESVQISSNRANLQQQDMIDENNNIVTN